MMQLLLAALVALASAACGKKEQSFEEGMEVICSARVHVPASLPPGERGAAVGKLIEERVKNAEARTIAERIPTLESGKVEFLRDAARRAGLDRCALAEDWASELASGLPVAAGQQSFADAVRVICEAPERAGIPPDADPASRSQALAEYIEENITNSQATGLMRELGGMGRDEVGARLRQVAKDAGVPRCPLAESPL